MLPASSAIPVTTTYLGFPTQPTCKCSRCQMLCSEISWYSRLLPFIIVVTCKPSSLRRGQGGQRHMIYAPCYISRTKMLVCRGSEERNHCTKHQQIIANQELDSRNQLVAEGRSCLCCVVAWSSAAADWLRYVALERLQSTRSSSL